VPLPLDLLRCRCLSRCRSHRRFPVPGLRTFAAACFSSYHRTMFVVRLSLPPRLRASHFHGCQALGELNFAGESAHWLHHMPSILEVSPASCVCVPVSSVPSSVLLIVDCWHAPQVPLSIIGFFFKMKSSAFRNHPHQHLDSTAAAPAVGGVVSG
jgi:hypothetical protein